MRPDGRVVAMVGGKNYAALALQPGDPGAAPAGLGVQVVRLSRRAARRLDARQHDRGQADHHRRLDAGEQRPRLSRPDHAARGLRPVEQCGDGAAVASRSAADNVIRAARDLGITTPLPDKPSLALGTAGVSLLELTSAYAAVASGRYPIAARGLPEEQPPEGLAAFFRSRRSARPAARLGADARPALRRRQQRHRPPRGARRADLRQDRARRRRIATRCSSALPATWSSACGSAATTTSRWARSAAAPCRPRSGAIS